MEILTLFERVLCGREGPPGSKPHQVHSVIGNELSAIIPALTRRGYSAIKSEYAVGAFGNYYVDFQSPNDRLRIIQDRGWYSIEGPSLAPTSDLTRGFGDKEVFVQAALEWLEQK